MLRLKLINVTKRAPKLSLVAVNLAAGATWRRWSDGSLDMINWHNILDWSCHPYNPSYWYMFWSKYWISVSVHPWVIIISVDPIGLVLMYRISGIILCMRPANERRRYNVTSSFIRWVHSQNDHWCIIRNYHMALILLCFLFFGMGRLLWVTSMPLKESYECPNHQCKLINLPWRICMYRSHGFLNILKANDISTTK